MAEVFDVRRIFRGVVRKALRLCHVMLPARVEEYDRLTRRASVQPQIRERFPDGQARDRALIASRPVVLPRGGGFGIWFDLEKGDPCITLVADETTAGYFETGEMTTPVFGQLHGHSDAVVLPGGAPNPEQSPVNGEGQSVVGYGDLTAAVIFSKATPSAPTQAGKVEVRASQRLDLGGVNGLPGSRGTDPVEPDENLISIIGALAGFVNGVVPGSVPAPLLAAFAVKMGTITPRADAKVYSE